MLLLQGASYLFIFLEYLASAGLAFLVGRSHSTSGNVRCRREIYFARGNYFLRYKMFAREFSLGDGFLRDDMFCPRRGHFISVPCRVHPFFSACTVGDGRDGGMQRDQVGRWLMSCGTDSRRKKERKRGRWMRGWVGGWMGGLMGFESGSVRCTLYCRAGLVLFGWHGGE